MKKKQKSSLLLLEDVKNLGRKGDLVSPKPGFVRNFLLPRGLVAIADKSTLQLRARLQRERAEQALRDREEAELLAGRLRDKLFSIEVKADSQGHLYGSVNAVDVVRLLEREEGIRVERRDVQLKPIKSVGKYALVLRLKENVSVDFTLEVLREEEGASTFEENPVEKAPDMEESPLQSEGGDAGSEE